jgi:hypothetical protein
MPQLMNIRANFWPDLGVWKVHIGEIKTEVTPREFTEMVDKMRAFGVPRGVGKVTVEFKLPGTNPCTVCLRDTSVGQWFGIRDYFVKCEDSYQSFRRRRPGDGQNYTEGT